jgi:GDPmannose 4,6-dehydratase
MYKPMKRALISGISGQDGSYLAHYLLSKGYKVYGTSRKAESNNFFRLKKLNIYKDIHLLSMSLSNFKDVFRVLDEVHPDEIYNLAGQTSVGASFQYPMECENSIVGGTINLLESVRIIDSKIKIYNAGSSEMFGDTGLIRANEKHLLNPVSPYGVSKASSFMHVRSYRDAYNVYACTGILGNHDSALRGMNFVTQKIVHGAQEIRLKKSFKIKLGNIDTVRDWGCSFEYVKAMHLMMANDKPADFIIATGVSYSLREFAREVFKLNNLDFSEYIEIDKSLFRPNDINATRLDPSKAERVLGWKSSIDLKKLARIMVNGDLL